MPSLRLIFSWSFLMYRWYSDAPYGIGKRGDRPGHVAGSDVGLGVVCGIYRIAFHALTSLLCVACTILALKAFPEGGE